MRMKPTTAQPDEWIEQAPHRCSASKELGATTAQVWEVLADHKSWPEWFDAVSEVTVTGPASGVGARRRVRLPGLVIDEEFVAWDVGERFAFTAMALSRGLFDSINERVTLDDLGDGRSRITYVQAFAPKRWLPFSAVEGRFRKGLEGALDNLATRFG